MKIAMYVRVSTQRQNQAQTIEQQIELLRQYNRKQGWEWKEEHLFRDDGGSASQFAPPWAGWVAR